MSRARSSDKKGVRVRSFLYFPVLRVVCIAAGAGLLVTRVLAGDVVRFEDLAAELARAQDATEEQAIARRISERLGTVSPETQARWESAILNKAQALLGRSDEALPRIETLLRVLGDAASVSTGTQDRLLEDLGRRVAGASESVQGPELRLRRAYWGALIGKFGDPRRPSISQERFLRLLEVAGDDRVGIFNHYLPTLKEPARVVDAVISEGKRRDLWSPTLRYLVEHWNSSFDGLQAALNRSRNADFLALTLDLSPQVLLVSDVQVPAHLVPELVDYVSGSTYRSEQAEQALRYLLREVTQRVSLQSPAPAAEGLSALLKITQFLPDQESNRLVSALRSTWKRIATGEQWAPSRLALMEALAQTREERYRLEMRKEIAQASADASPEVRKWALSAAGQMGQAGGTPCAERYLRLVSPPIRKN